MPSAGRKPRRIMERRSLGVEARQLELPLPNTWGGARRGAGRKPRQGRRSVPHRARPVHRAAHPVHVTLRYRVRSLRRQAVFPTVTGVIARTNERWAGRFRVVHFSVQPDHVHLLVEASDRDALALALRGFSIRLARQLNQLLFRKGPLSADRWHGRALETPRAVRHALVYVLANFRKHGNSRALIDACSSAPYFSDFVECRGRTPAELDPKLVPLTRRDTGPPTLAARTWLLRVGWQRHGAISCTERPARANVPTPR